MKCPKCGSINIYRECGMSICECCHFGWDGIKQPELTTAEMLLWLAENYGIISSRFRLQIRNRNTGDCTNYYWDDKGRHDNPEVEQIKVADRTEAINAAYEWARRR